MDRVGDPVQAAQASNTSLRGTIKALDGALFDDEIQAEASTIFNKKATNDVHYFDGTSWQKFTDTEIVSHFSHSGTSSIAQAGPGCRIMSVIRPLS